MKILITGGGGFIGSHLAEALIMGGHEVHIIDNFSTGLKQNIPKDVKLWETDIRSETTRSLVREQKFEIIFHYAAQLNLRKSVEDPIYDADVNILGSLQLLEAAVAGGTRLFIFASSGGTVYGEQTIFPAPENHPLQPVSPYGIAKLATEHHLFYYYHAFGLPYIALRFSNVYGPRQNPHGEAGVVAIFLEKLLKKEQCIINGDGLQTRDYIYIKDVININLKLLEHFGSPASPIIGTFNVGTGIETNVIEIFHEIQNNGFRDAKVIHGPAKKGEQRRSVISPRKLKDLLGWTPEYSLSKGMQETVSWFTEHKNRF